MSLGPTSKSVKTREEVISVLRALRRQVHENFKADLVGVFGSYARGEAHSESDVDVLTRFHEGASMFDLVGLADFLEEKLGLKVDIVSERAVGPELRERILREIIWL